ncbi:DUF5670 family protein [Danxiaibacter flavus]|uniref:DUF5670 family protein n=1 Tax=Danxiaibacter flavus TaxID=3049108 RepID=A0ABV3ZL39_9BACT|nr:DUF5670 family protein [Chitinophagaceae bacterium DXS]
MKGILFFIGIILVIAWIFGFIVYHTASALIHLLIFFAVLSFIFGGLSKRRT